MVRDVQDRTGWPYAHTLFIIEQLGYEFVSKEVDDAPEDALEDLREVLGQRARAAQKESK